MAKVSFTNLKLKPNINTSEVIYNDQKIEVLNYLPIEDKLDLIQITLQKSQTEDGSFDPILTEAYFNLNIVYLYTNINFTEKQREDEMKLYNLLEGNGLLDEIIAAIPADEYNALVEYLNDTIENKINVSGNIGLVVDRLLKELPVNAENAAAIIKEFDPEQFQNVIQFAQAANGNRPIE